MRRVSVLVLTLAVVGIAVAFNPLPLDNSLHHYARSWLHDRWSICLGQTWQSTADYACKVHSLATGSDRHVLWHVEPGATLQDKDNSTAGFDPAQLPISVSQGPLQQHGKAAGMCQLSGTVQDCCKLPTSYQLPAPAPW